MNLSLIFSANSFHCLPPSIKRLLREASRKNHDRQQAFMLYILIYNQHLRYFERNAYLSRKKNVLVPRFLKQGVKNSINLGGMKMTEMTEEITRLSYEIHCILEGENAPLCICSLGSVLSGIIYQNIKDPLKRRKILREFYETALSTLRGMEGNEARN